jgi:hypothetical protein
VTQNECSDYTHGGDTQCRLCPDANSIVLDSTLDNCICKDGYVPQGGTSSRQENLKCAACAAGTFALAGDATCTPCTGNTYSNAAAISCQACPADTQANVLKTDCVCVGTGCIKSGSGWSTVCSSCSGGSTAPGEQAVDKVPCPHSGLSTLTTQASHTTAVAEV